MSSAHDSYALRWGPAWLFCPGDRPGRFAKAAAAADLVILDLEDAVTIDAKSAARAAVVAASVDLDPDRTIVRVNAIGTTFGQEDLRALATTPLRTIMLPKAHAAGQLDELEDFSVIPLCETAAGVLAAPQLAAHPRSIALTWGGQDLAADLGASPLDTAGRMGTTAAWARTAVRFAAAAAGIPAVDTVWVDLDDVDGLAAETSDAADAGYHAKLVIHPLQVPTVQAAFAPSSEEVAAARRIVRAASDAAASGRGVVQMDGKMIDAPVVARARNLLARAR